ncbi:hypothetical protein DTO021D3_9059 [Paecilomyces variotii]|nr:hypothetical protein DTO032I3_8176 [Paecilomyces variotii]KAJ9274065.1 hypothetical protein DTO021D3_9059 [Paecilomyces variotii]KAJ9338554.1 hypothetical protein DTO027B6_8901 [Paecilomyces variotii]KAJ9378406.1 hypothetical protein DTO032I4_7656 [Paecilomyces variotii]
MYHVGNQLIFETPRSSIKLAVRGGTSRSVRYNWYDNFGPAISGIFVTRMGITNRRNVPSVIDTTVVDADVEADSEADNAFSSHVLRKIDLRLMPLLFITYNLNFMDKTILSSAAVFGLEEDTHLKGSQYSWVSSIFYFGYLFWQYPTSVLIQKLPVGKYVSINTLFWGTVVALTAACTNFGGLLAVRFLLGVAEATISPAFLFITSMWYTREEVPTRVGVWFSGNAIGGIFASFIAYGIGHIERPFSPWRWLYIILGVATFIWGWVLLAFLPDSIMSAKFLTEEQRKVAEGRVQAAGTGKGKSSWKTSQITECLLDPKTFFFVGISLLAQIPNGGTQNFGNLVLKGFGFTSLQTTLVTLPASVISFTVILITGRLSSEFQNVTTYLLIIIVIFPVIGSAIIYTNVSKGLNLFAYYLLSTGPGALPLSMSLVGVNYKGSTKKLTMSALLFIAYCTGNICGPLFFKSSEAPHYHTAFRAIIICYSFVIILALGLRVYLVLVNRWRDEIESNEGRNTETELLIGDEQADNKDDVTDLRARGFRYRM